MIDYVLALTERLEIGTAMRTQMDAGTGSHQLEGMQPGVEQPVYGVAFYMVTGLIPSFETISFQLVVDENDARRLLNGGKANYGDSGYHGRTGRRLLQDRISLRQTQRKCPMVMTSRRLPPTTIDRMVHGSMSRRSSRRMAGSLSKPRIP